jgi:hypothetical protein
LPRNGLPCTSIRSTGGGFSFSSFFGGGSFGVVDVSGLGGALTSLSSVLVAPAFPGVFGSSGIGLGPRLPGAGFFNDFFGGACDTSFLISCTIDSFSFTEI